MTPRQLRRAAERKQHKQERQAAAASFSPQPDSARQPTRSPERSDELISDPQLAANRANAQLSTGPKSIEGKAKSALNAVTSALTGRTVLLPSDDAALYENHVREYFREIKPVGLREHSLAQSLADTAWRLDRITGLEMAVYAQGHIQFAAQFEHEDPALRSGLIEFQTHLAYEKQLRNLHIQEMRLRRQREKDSAELRRLQQERICQEKEDLDTAAKLYTAAQHDHASFDPAEFGFDFSTADVETYLTGVRAANLLNASLKRDREVAQSHAAA